MNTNHDDFREVFDEVNILSVADKVKFFDDILFCSTLSGRAIWSDDHATSEEIVNAFKWLNELQHRVWNIRSDLQHTEECDSLTKLYDNMKFYGEQSSLLNKLHAPIKLTTSGRIKLTTFFAGEDFHFMYSQAFQN